ncbi:hypothetical protein DFH06DRAFT_1142658 [Mycena polygramma]|nr:hypothetical protein DFH06DRAFT_1142658 [Mycena polygramma]
MDRGSCAATSLIGMPFASATHLRSDRQHAVKGLLGPLRCMSKWGLRGPIRRADGATMSQRFPFGNAPGGYLRAVVRSETKSDRSSDILPRLIMGAVSAACSGSVKAAIQSTAPIQLLNGNPGPAQRNADSAHPPHPPIRWSRPPPLSSKTVHCSKSRTASNSCQWLACNPQIDSQMGPGWASGNTLHPNLHANLLTGKTSLFLDYAPAQLDNLRARLSESLDIIHHRTASNLCSDCSVDEPRPLNHWQMVLRIWRMAPPRPPYTAITSEASET